MKQFLTSAAIFAGAASAVSVYGQVRILGRHADSSVWLASAVEAGNDVEVNPGRLQLVPLQQLKAGPASSNPPLLRYVSD